jgi:hypothetical protein
MRLARLATTGLLAGGLVFGVAACGGSSTGSSSGGSSAAPSAAAPSAASSAAPQAEIAQLKGTDTAVAVEPSVLAALKSLGVTPTPTGKGKLTMQYGPTLDFPITGGNVKIFDKTQVTPYVQGTIDHEGSGLNFSGAGKSLTVQNFVVDPGTSILTAEVKEMNNAKVPLFALDGTDLAISMDPQGKAKLDGTKVLLTPEAATALNTTFGVQAFKPMMLIGTAHITAN